MHAVQQKENQLPLTQKNLKKDARVVMVGRTLNETSGHVPGAKVQFT